MKTETEIRAEIDMINRELRLEDEMPSMTFSERRNLTSFMTALKWVLADTQPQETPNADN